jgi:hypothetical protein
MLSEMKTSNTFTGTVFLHNDVKQVNNLQFFQTVQIVMRARRLKEKEK